MMLVPHPVGVVGVVVLEPEDDSSHVPVADRLDELAFGHVVREFLSFGNGRRSEIRKLLVELFPLVEGGTADARALAGELDNRIFRKLLEERFFHSFGLSFL